MDVSDENLKLICERMKYFHCLNGETVFRFGDIGNNFYIILSGKVSILVPKKGIKVGGAGNVQNKATKELKRIKEQNEE
jgi:CRP-like cAMP-binding protein